MRSGAWLGLVIPVALAILWEVAVRNGLGLRPADAAAVPPGADGMVAGPFG
jgi:hypothetical protein